MHFVIPVVALSLAISLISVLISGSFDSKMAATPVAISRDDPSSYCNADVFVMKHLNLNWTVDFASKTISGSAELTFEANPNRPADADKLRLILDSKGLAISSAKLKGDGETDLNFSLGAAHPAFGSPLVLGLPAAVRDSASFVVVIAYSTTPVASALQWLEPRLTAGKKKPFVYSQCQAIHARSLVPCQDTPAVKFTYAAKVVAPEDLVVLMSAVKNEVKTVVRCE